MKKVLLLVLIMFMMVIAPAQTGIFLKGEFYFNVFYDNYYNSIYSFQGVVFDLKLKQDDLLLGINAGVYFKDLKSYFMPEVYAGYKFTTNSTLFEVKCGPTTFMVSDEIVPDNLYFNFMAKMKLGKDKEDNFLGYWLLTGAYVGVNNNKKIFNDYLIYLGISCYLGRD